MKSLGSWITVGLLALAASGVSGCSSKEEPPKPDPAAVGTATPRLQTSGRNKLNNRAPLGPLAKIDPQAMKDYRLDVCYFGTLSLREARDAYLGSMGTAEPSEKKIPSFGVPAAPTPPGGAPAASGAPSAQPAAKPAPKPSAAPSSQPGTAAQPSGSAAAPMPLPDRRPDVIMRAPHERNARACTAAVALKEPAMPEVDAALGAYATFAVELAKDITAAHTYYARDEHKKDNFAKGKEYDKKLREGFGKLDDLQSKLGAALSAWRKAHPVDTSKMDEGEKLARAGIEDARAVYELVVFKKAEGDAWKNAVAALEKSTGAVKTYAEAHGTEPWAKILSGPFDAFLKTVKDAKVTKDNTFEPEPFLNLVSGFTGLIEARQRAVSRHAMTRQLNAPAAVSGQPAPAPAPPPDQAPAPEQK
jgi:hypothetical protein